MSNKEDEQLLDAPASAETSDAPNNKADLSRRALLRKGALGTAAIGVGAGVAFVGASPAQAATLDFAGWVHGTSVQVELPGNIASITRYGFFTRIYGKPGTYNWLHFAIPTAVIEDGVRVRAGSALVRYKTANSNSWIHAFHVYDGERKIASYDNRYLWSTSYSTPRYYVPNTPYVYWGVGISLGVRFGTALVPHYIDLVTAGVDFVR